MPWTSFEAAATSGAPAAAGGASSLSLGRQLTDEDISLEWTPTSLTLIVSAPASDDGGDGGDDGDGDDGDGGQPKRAQFVLSLPRLHGEIKACVTQKKAKRLVVTATKKSPRGWSALQKA